MDNKSIFKKIVPFLAIFVMTLLYGGYSAIEQSLAPAQADNSSVNIDVVNVQAPKSAAETWQWNAFVIVNKYFKDPFDATYTVNWCGKSYEGAEEAQQLPCDPSYYESTFKEELAKGTINIDPRDTVVMFDHKGVDCGRVEATVEALGEKKDVEIVDTGISCAEENVQGFTDSQVSAFSADGSLNIPLSEVFSDLSKFINAGSDIDYSEYPDDSSQIPGQPSGVPQPTGSAQNPNLPSNQPPIPSTNNSDAQHAINLANYLIRNCAGNVNKNNYLRCVPGLNIKSKNDTLAVQKIKWSTAAYHDLQCVGFTQAAVAASMGINYAGSGHAKARAVSHSGFTFVPGNKPPAVNDLVVFNWYTYGHIAYITKVSPRAFEVVEASMPDWGDIRSYSYTINHPNLAGWLRR